MAPVFADAALQKLLEEGRTLVGGLAQPIFNQGIGIKRARLRSAQGFRE